MNKEVSLVPTEVILDINSQISALYQNNPDYTDLVTKQMNAMSAVLLPPSKEEKTKSATQMRIDRLVKRVQFKGRFIQVWVDQDDESPTIFLHKQGEPRFYRWSNAEANKMVLQEYKKAFGDTAIISATEMDSVIKTLKLNVGEQFDKINNKVIHLGGDLYWDLEKIDFTSQPSIDTPCMRGLFDNYDGEILSVDINDINPGIIQEMYEITLDHLARNDGTIIPAEQAPKNDLGLSSATAEDSEFLSIKSQPLNAFWVWANYDLDTFNDLLKAVASNFMGEKPMGAFFLIGLRRNGKSSFTKMLHTLFGRKNTSSVRLSQFEDHNVNGDLWTTIMNAPDEEDDADEKTMKRVQANFKSIAAHESLKIKELYKQGGKRVRAEEFMNFFTANHLPKWGDSTGAAACNKRTLPIEFKNDLSRMDNNGKNFEKETYTPMFYSNLLGIVLAIASYWAETGMTFSPTLYRCQSRIAYSSDSVTAFLEEFHRFFDGYSKTGLMYEEYKLWCSENDLKIHKRKVLADALEMRTKDVWHTTIGDKKYMFHLTTTKSRKESRLFYLELPLEELGGRTVESCILDENNTKKDFSVVNELAFRERVAKDEPSGQNY